MNFQSPGEIRLTMIMFLSLLVAFIMVSFNANAYIPSSHFVFDRVTSQHGKGAYMIDQDVIFNEGIDRLVVKENWMIVDGGEMRIQAQAEGFRLYKFLKRGRVFWVDQEGSERASEPSPDFFMTPLMIRNPLDLKRFFVKWNALSPDALKEKRPIKELKDVKVETEPFVRLGRVSGSVTYTYGKPSPPNGPALPGLWIEQDAFVIRKMRSPSGAEFYGNSYFPYSKNLFFPRSQTITFDSHSVEIRVTRVANLGDLNKEQQRQMEPSSLRNRPDASALWPKSPLAPVLQEFYKRFR